MIVLIIGSQVTTNLILTPRIASEALIPWIYLAFNSD